MREHLAGQGPLSKAETYAATSMSIDGPWLLDAQQLASLGALLDEEWERLDTRRNRLIGQYVDKVVRDAGKEASNSNAADAKLSKADRTEFRKRAKADAEADYNLGARRVVTLVLEGGQKSHAETFDELLRLPELAAQRVIGWAVAWKSAGISMQLGSSSGDRSLNLSTGPEKNPDARQLFAVVRDKLTEDGFAPSKVVRTWSFGGEVAIVIGIFALMFLLTGLLISTPPDSNQQAVARLLEGGIAADEYPRVLELLLARAYPQPLYTRLTFPYWFKWSGVMFAVALPFLIVRPPALELGIGRGRQRLIWWRRWITLGTVTIPFAIASQLGVVAWQLLVRTLGL